MTNMTVNNGRFVWYEQLAKDPKKAIDFYTVRHLDMIVNPQGNILSMFTPSGAIAPHESSKAGEFCWNELLTSDYAAAFDLYSKIFRWKVIQNVEMGPMGTYRVYGIGDK